MQIIYHLGQKLSEKVKVSEAASRGLIKLAIKDEFGPFKPLHTLGLRDFQVVLFNSLKNRLIKLDIEDPDEIISFLLNELLENQSLITMEKV